MKYYIEHIALPETEREAYNTTIAAAIAGDSTDKPDPQEVFNRYTGKGGLHGLSRKDYGSYYAYAEAKKELEQGQFFTPPALCAQIIEALQPQQGFAIADLTCGMGNFFNYLPNEANIYGNELDGDTAAVCKFLYPQARIDNRDFLYCQPDTLFDLIIGNPPFNLPTEHGTSQYAYIRKSYELLHFGGLLAVIVPASFLNDDFLEHRKIDWLNERFNFVCACLLPANAFTATIQTKLLVLQKKGITNSNQTYTPDNLTAFVPAQLYSRYIAPLYQQNEQDAARLHLLTVQAAIDEDDMQYRIRRRLWHIKTSPALRKYHPKALQKLAQLHSQQQPEDVSDREWERIRLTPAKILNWMQKLVKAQNTPKPQKVCKLVKTSYGLHYKAYHPKLQPQSWQRSFTELMQTPEQFAEYGQYRKLLERRKRKLDRQNIPFPELQRDGAVDRFLHSFRLTPFIADGCLFPATDAPEITLNDKQRYDLGLALQKTYGLLAWEQGGGKSVAGMAWLHYHQPSVYCSFVLAPALAINTTWRERLYAYGFDFIQLQSISDTYSLKKGQVAIISYDQLTILQRHIKAFIKRRGYRVALLVDESDELTNAGSQRSKAALACFRKAKYKLLTTGTTTRNNINELYTQLELLYNNSDAFRCEAETVYHVNKEGGIEESYNDYYGYPFPAFRGAGLFKACFCPQKKTVFGINKETQDVYNANVLKVLINKTIITRKFEEIVGERKHSIHTHSIRQTEAEQALYQILLTEFLKVCYDFYTSTGNDRKEAALRLIRQIKALIKATSVPHLMPHYEGTGLPNKYHEISRLVTDWTQERVTIGTIFKSAARDYFRYMQRCFPFRSLFYIDGEYSIARRRRILEQFKQAHNGILVCTQQSLKSSVNIPYCNKCIIESLQWNIPKMSQFYFRFIRFDSTRHTEVHFVNYENTIELNLLALLMAKEKLNDFIKTTNVASTESIYGEFGVDLNILDALLEKNYDNEGKLYLSWGKQQLLKSA